MARLLSTFFTPRAVRVRGADHAFQWADNKDRYREGASEDAWRRALAFFAEKLK